jgi:GT2 family glycosyltransferase
MEDTVIIILNWNKSDLTTKLINNIQETEGNVNVIVVDNKSNEEERKKLEKSLHEKNYLFINENDLNNEELLQKIDKGKNLCLFLNKNYGYAKGNNFGLKLAHKLGYKFAVISNNDILIEEPVINELKLKMKEDDEIAVIGPKIIGPDGRIQSPSDKVGIFEYVLLPIFYPFLYPILKFKLKKFFQVNHSGITYPYVILGCFMVLRLDYMSKIDYFDENTFLYAEELILAEKLKKFGWKMAFYPKIYVKHLHGESTKVLGEMKKYFLQLKSDLYYFEKYRKFNKIIIWLIFLAKSFDFFVWNSPRLLIKRFLKFIKRNGRKIS